MEVLQGLGGGGRASRMLGKLSTSELRPQLYDFSRIDFPTVLGVMVIRKYQLLSTTKGQVLWAI